MTWWWSVGPDGAPVTYGNVYHQNEVEQSTYNFEHANVDWLFSPVRRIRSPRPSA